MKPISHSVWHQTYDIICIEIPVLCIQKISVTFNVKSLCIQVLTDKTHDNIPQPILECELLHEICPFDSTWYQQTEPNIFVIELIKKDKNIWWDELFDKGIPIK